MKTTVYHYKRGEMILDSNSDAHDGQNAQLVIFFGLKRYVSSSKAYQIARKSFPNATLIAVSSGGEIFGSNVQMDSVSFLALQFEKTEIKTYTISKEEFEANSNIGDSLYNKIDKTGLTNLMVLGNSWQINSDKLLKTLQKYVDQDIKVFGGFAGDFTGDLAETYLGMNKMNAEDYLIAIGFYGDAIQISNNYATGWDTFGPERIITKSNDNEVFEIDGKAALDLYTRYLGDEANNLESVASFFPFCIHSKSGSLLTRTVVGFNHEKKSIQFLSAMPQGTRVRLMRSNKEKIILAANEAANQCKKEMTPRLTLVLSCTARKSVLQNRVDEEIEALRDVFGKDTLITGFYTNGEIITDTQTKEVQFLNQTINLISINEL